MPRTRLRWIAAVVAAACALGAPPARADGVHPASATPVQREQAQSRFVKGRELYTKKDYARALDEFRASHDIVSSPNARLYAARCLRELGKLVAAYVEFGRAAIEAKELSPEDGRYARTGQSAEDERRAIAPHLAFVSVTVQNAKDDTTLKVTGEEIRRQGWSEPIPALPGATDVEVASPGRQPLTQTVVLAAGQTKAIAFDADAALSLTPPPPPVETPAPPPDDGERTRKTLRTASYVSAGVGVAGLATFAVFGALSASKFDSLKTTCGGPCPPSRQSDVDEGQRDQTIANVGLVVGLIGAAGAVTLFIVSAPKKTPAPQAGLIVRPGGIGVGGSF